MASKRQDGQSVEVVSNATLDKDIPVYLQGFCGFTQDRSVSGDKVVLATDGAVYEFAVPSGVTAPRGTVLYMTVDGTHVISASAGAGKAPFAVVTEAKDSNNIVWAKQLPQGQPVGA